MAQTPTYPDIIDLTTEERGDDGYEERNLIIIEAFFDSPSSRVKVIAIGVGRNIVIIKNSSGQTVAQTVIYPTDGIGALVVPEVSDIYQITIDSSRYHSYGYFMKI